MDRDELNTPVTGPGPDQIEKLRLLVTLQNQIVEQARRNLQAQRDCADLSQRIVRETTRRESRRRGKLDWLRQQLKRVGSLAWRRWLAPEITRKNETSPVLSNDGLSGVSRGELAVAKSVRNR